jgi:hypothetical protein
MDPKFGGEKKKKQQAKIETIEIKILWSVADCTRKD